MAVKNEHEKVMDIYEKMVRKQPVTQEERTMLDEYAKKRFGI